ncbi:hypothetical protein N9N67_02935 [Bacteriovoracaceae bacterium]|nr:hypothetical protein [Bacteriovoracaceae bacterium]
MQTLALMTAILFSSTYLSAQSLGFWERAKKVSKKKEIFVDCERFCEPANEHEKYNNCNGVYLRKRRKANEQHPKHNDPLHYYSKRGGICAKKKNFNFRSKIKFKDVEKLCSCKSKVPAKSVPSKRSQVDKPITSSTLAKLKSLHNKVNNWILCHDLSYGRYSSPESVKPCAQISGLKIPVTNLEYGKVEGDKIYHMGQLCLSGSKEFCDGVKECQDVEPGSSTFGAFYRSPGTKKDPTYTGNKGTHFSRDMMLGMLAYFVRSKDKEAAINWINFVEKNKKVSRADFPIVRWLKKTNICPLIGGESKADDRCALVPDSWGVMHQVYNYLGLMNSPRISRKMKRKMKGGKLATDLGHFFNATFSPGEGKSVYMASLVVNNILVRRQTGQDTGSMRFGAKQMAKKSRYINPFFMFADMGATEQGAQMLLKFCPAERPKFQQRAFPNGPHIRGVNLWNRLSFFQTRQPYGWYQVSGGYDCLMALNYYLGYHKGNNDS